MRKAVLLLLIITKGVNCGFSGDGIVLSCGPALLRTAYNSQPAVLQVECSVRPGVFVWTTVLALVYYTGIQRPTFVKKCGQSSHFMQGLPSSLGLYFPTFVIALFREWHCAPIR
jgi:hypothetical protein